MTVSRVCMTAKDLEVSRFIAGFWRQNSWGYSDQELQGYIESLLDLGITTFDHAWVYRTEESFGRVLAAAPHLRDEMEIISKFGVLPTGFGELGAQGTNHYDSSPAYLQRSLEVTLKHLQTEQIDVLLVHRPDYLMNAEELASAFDTLRVQGKVRHFGVSNFSASQFELLQSACDFPLVTNQVEFSPLSLAPLDNGVFDQCQRLGVSPMLWSCLGGGRMFSGEDEQTQRLRNALQQVGEQIGASSLDQVIYAWVMTLPGSVLPMLGTGRLDRVKSAIAAEHLKLTREQWYSIREASTGSRVP